MKQLTQTQKKRLVLVGTVLLVLLALLASLAAGIYLRSSHAGDGSPSAQAGGAQVFLELDPQLPACTICIRCDTILENPDKITEALQPLLPEDGILLPDTACCFEPGATVFDVLKAVCETGEIALEYTWTPGLDSYYIEGIGHLYEFDCGSQSGWVYLVNGELPPKSCSAYTLSDGDVIEWHYTCDGLGADVGSFAA